MKKKYKNYTAVLAVVCVMIAGACASSAPEVTIEVTRVPTMNTLGIRRIAIEPFTTSDNSDAQRKIASVITTEVTRRIQETNYFTMVDYSEVKRLQDRNENVENHVDAVFIGQVVSLKVDSGSRQVEVYNILSRKNETITYYNRKVELSFSYNFKRTRDGSLVGVVTKRGIAEDEQTDRGAVKSEDQLLQLIVTNRLGTLAHDVAPWKENRSYAMLPASSRADKDTQARMAGALELIKEGSYKQALNEYEAIYADKKSFEAGYNASLLHEALGDIDEAMRVAQDLADETGNPAANQRIAAINKIIADREAVEGVFSDQRSQFDKVMAAAIPLITKNLPPRYTVAVRNVSSQGDRELAGRAIDTITDALREAKVVLVEQDNAAMLSAERNYQGRNWEDFDEMTIASFGQAAGIQAFVLVSITGTSDSRRLQVRILDVSRGTIIYQTPLSDEMKL
jgi:tetratricopeptide (TPR) repeat protein